MPLFDPSMDTPPPQNFDPELLVFVRHGQTDWNAEGRMQGQRDIPLNETGIGQARGNGRRLKAFVDAQRIDPAKLDFIASPLGRTRMTMELMRAEMALDTAAYRKDDRLLEITFGDWEGKTLEELGLDFPDLVALRREDKWAFVPPRGESYRMLSERIAGWLATVERPSVVVAHGGVLRVLRGLLEGHDSIVIPKLPVPQDVVFIWRNGRFETV